MLGVRKRRASKNLLNPAGNQNSLSLSLSLSSSPKWKNPGKPLHVSTPLKRKKRNLSISLSSLSLSRYIQVVSCTDAEFMQATRSLLSENEFDPEILARTTPPEKKANRKRDQADEVRVREEPVRNVLVFFASFHLSYLVFCLALRLPLIG